MHKRQGTSPTKRLHRSPRPTHCHGPLPRKCPLKVFRKTCTVGEQWPTKGPSGHNPSGARAPHEPTEAATSLNNAAPCSIHLGISPSDKRWSTPVEGGMLRMRQLHPGTSAWRILALESRQGASCARCVRLHPNEGRKVQHQSPKLSHICHERGISAISRSKMARRQGGGVALPSRLVCLAKYAV